MSLTPQQIESLTLQARTRGYDAQTTQRFLEFADKKSTETASDTSPVEVIERPGILKKIGSALISSEKGVGESLASGIIPTLPEFKSAEQAGQQEADLLSKVAQRIREKKAKGEDVTQLLEYYKRASGESPSFNYEELNPASTKSTQQALAEVAGVGLDVLTAGTYGAATKGMKAGQLATKALPTIAKPLATKAVETSILKGAGKGALGAAKTAVPVGAAYGAVNAAKEDGDLGDIALGALKGGVTGLIIGGTLGAITGGTSAYLQKRTALKEHAQELVNKKLAENPNAITPEVVKKSKSLGVDEKYAKVIVEADPDDKSVFQKMFKDAQQGSDDMLYAKNNRPIDNAGETFLKRIPVLKKAREEAGKKIGEIVDKFPKTPTDVSDVYKSFTSEMSSAGVSVSKDGKLNFAASEFANDGTAKKLFQQLFNDLRPGKNGTSQLAPKTINIIRRRISNDGNLTSQMGAVSMSSNADRILTISKTKLGKILESYSDDFAKYSAEYSELSDVLNRTNSLLGKDFKLGSSMANRKGGEIMRRLLSNSSARPTQIAEDIDRLAKIYDPTIKGDIGRQLIFADMLEDLFGLTPPNSLGGQVQRANERVIQEGVGIAEDVANRNVGNLLYKGGMAVFRKVKGITPEKQQAYISELIGLGGNTVKKSAMPPLVKAIEKLPAMTDAQYADDAAALLKATEKKAPSLVEEAAALTSKRGGMPRLFDKQQTQIEKLLNGNKVKEALKIAESIKATTKKEEAMRVSLINMIKGMLE